MRDFLAQRTALIGDAIPGIGAARELCAMTDEAVRELSRAASPLHAGRWAIVALGGWGAGALLPDSDLDILVLSETPADKLRPFVEALLYPLWDAGLKVGHQVRSPARQQAAMREDLETMTAAFTGRALAGEQEWATDVLRQCTAKAGKRPRRLLAEITTRERPGSPWLLEHDLKNGAGGRRDYDELTWTAALLTGSVQHSPDALVSLGLLTDRELDVLLEAAETVSAARWLLQREGFCDRLTIEAEALLSEEQSGDTDAMPAERFDAEAVQAALGETAVLLERVRIRIAGTALESRIAAVLLGSSASVTEKTVVDTVEPLTANELFALLGEGESAIASVSLAAQTGALDELVPGFRRLMSTRRPGLGHQLTVGAHCIATAATVGSMRSDPTLAKSLESVGDLRVAQAAALVHDAGKLKSGAGHAERGAQPAAETARLLGLDDAQAADVADLVRLHLLLIETALREDLDDEDAILRCAAAIGRAELLAPLHLLTAADSQATGPSTWTPWTAALVGTLVARLDAALSPEVDGAGLAARGEEVRRSALAALGESTDRRAGTEVSAPATNAAVAATDMATSPTEKTFVASAPLRYLAGRVPAQVVRDARLIADFSAHGPARHAAIAVSPGPVSGTHSVTIAASEQPHLLARLAGALALAGLDILSVDAFSAPGGIALDTFVVTSATKRPVTPETFSAVERFVDAALRDRLELAVRLAERRRHYPTRSKRAVRVTTRVNGWDTAIEVKAPDRPGLLHDIARAIADQSVDVRWAKAVSIDGIARDSFHVVDDDGGPIGDPGVLGHLAMRIREAAG